MFQPQEFEALGIRFPRMQMQKQASDDPKVMYTPEKIKEAVLKDPRAAKVWKQLDETKQAEFLRLSAERVNKSILSGNSEMGRLLLTSGSAAAIGGGLGYLFGDGQGALIGGILGALVGFFAEMTGVATKHVYQPFMMAAERGQLATYGAEVAETAKATQEAEAADKRLFGEGAGEGAQAQEQSDAESIRKEEEMMAQQEQYAKEFQISDIEAQKLQDAASAGTAEAPAEAPAGNYPSPEGTDARIPDEMIEVNRPRGTWEINYDPSENPAIQDPQNVQVIPPSLPDFDKQKQQEMQHIQNLLARQDRAEAPAGNYPSPEGTDARIPDEMIEVNRPKGPPEVYASSPSATSKEISEFVKDQREAKAQRSSEAITRAAGGTGFRSMLAGAYHAGNPMNWPSHWKHSAKTNRNLAGHVADKGDQLRSSLTHL